MQSVFLSYTYNAHPDHAEQTNRLVMAARIVVESLNLQVLDGFDLGGRAIDSEIVKRIDAADALVAVVTPKAGDGGAPVTPPYVDDEYKYARGQRKPAIRLLHQLLPVAGFGTQDEYIPYIPGKELEAMMKLLRTVALWKRQLGGPREIQLEPSELGGRFDMRREHKCEYKLMVDHRECDWQSATIWPEPGVTYAFLPSVPDQSRVRLRLSLGNEVWMSDFTDPKGRIALFKR